MLKYLWEFRDNTEDLVAELHLDHELPYTSYPDRKRDELLLETVRRVPGVEDIDVNRYHFVIKKGVLFRWDEIQPKVIAALKAWHDERGEVVEITAVVPSGSDSYDQH